MTLFSLVAGWTAPLPVQTIRLNGVPLDLTGMTITLILRRASGELVTVGGTITIRNQTSFPGQVIFTPAEGDFTFEDNQYTVEQLYQQHWKITDANSDVAFSPSGEADTIVVYRA